LPEFPQTSRNDFYAIFDYKFSPTKIIKTFFGVTSKKGLHVFYCKPWAPLFLSQATFGAIFTRIFKDAAQFSANENFWRCACAPTSNTTAFHNSIIGNFAVYQDRLQTYSLQLFEHPENSELFSIISVVIFEANIVDEQKET